jgi:hypothetical protein
MRSAHNLLGPLRRNDGCSAARRIYAVDQMSEMKLHEKHEQL